MRAGKAFLFAGKAFGDAGKAFLIPEKVFWRAKTRVRRIRVRRIR